jgi:acyl-CoA thioester hydrolase
VDKSHQGLGRDGGLKPLVISRIDNRAWPLFDPLDFTFQVVDFDAKRLHYFMTMLHANERWLAATSEAISICVDMATRRSTAWPADRLVRLCALHETHAQRPRPAELGRLIGIRRK